MAPLFSKHVWSFKSPPLIDDYKMYSSLLKFVFVSFLRLNIEAGT